MTPSDANPSNARRRLDTTIVIGCTAGLVPLAIVLGTLAIDRTPDAAAGASNLRQLFWFWGATALGWLTLTYLWHRLARAPATNATTDRLGPTSTAMCILGIAMLARIAVVLVHEPALSDDIHRYTFDGATLASGVNPYLETPLDRQTALATTPEAPRWPGEAAVAGLVNNPELHTIYLPTSQLAFAIAGATTPSAMVDPDGRARWLRWWLLAVDGIVIGLILLSLAWMKRSLWWATLYAWHPLTITEVAASGHQDVIGIALLLATLLVWSRRPRGVVLWTTLLAAASLVKPFVLPIALMILKGQPLRRWLTSLAVGAGVCLALTAPLLLTHDLAPLRNLETTSTRFSLKWAHFGSVYEPVLWGIETITNDPADAWERPEDGLWSNDEQERLARAVCALLVLGVLALVFFSRTDIWTKSRILLLAMVLFSSTAHPWYLLWALAIIPMAPSPTVWLASLMLPLGYAQLGDVVEWTTPPWVMAIAYIPVYIVLGLDVVRTWGGVRVET